MSINYDNEIDNEIKRHEKAIKSLKEEQLEHWKGCFWKCPSCKKRTQYQNLVYVEYYFYITPFGCTGGDYHNLSTIQITCKKCEKTHEIRVRDYGKNYMKEYLDINKKKEAFKEVKYKTAEGFCDSPPW